MEVKSSPNLDRTVLVYLIARISAKVFVCMTVPAECFEVVEVQRDLWIVDRVCCQIYLVMDNYRRTI